MLQVIENCCSTFYLDMLKHTATNSSNWNMKYPIGMEFEDKHLKLDIIDNEPINELLAGMAMLVLPGQGILTMVIGVSLLDFPGKRKLEHKLLTQAMVFQAINSIRAKCSKPPFDPPSESTFS